MGNVVNFDAHGKKYPVSIIEREDGRWVYLQQLGEALENKNPRRLLQVLRESGEMEEGIHCRNITERQPGETQARTRVELSARGMIRFIMRSQGQRAREFRKWAEEVLYQVMMTGHYEVDRALPAALETARCEGFNQALALTKVSAGSKVHLEILAKIIRFRKLGMTQTEVGAAFGFSKWQIQRMEADLKNAGIAIPAVRVARRDKKLLADLGGMLASNAGAPELFGRETAL